VTTNYHIYTILWIADKCPRNIPVWKCDHL